MGCKQANEVVKIGSDEHVSSNRKASGTGFKKVRHLECHEILIFTGVIGHVCDDADPQAQSNVGLDDIRIDGRECQSWMEPLGLKCPIQLRATGKAKGIGDDRKFSNRFEGQWRDLNERVPLGNQDAAIPSITGEGNQVIQGIG